MKPANQAQSEQESAASNRSAMIESEIDHILATEEELIPSSDFMAAVMERVQQESAVPPPIPFPWKRFIPGIVLAAGVFGWSAVELVRLGIPALDSAKETIPHLPAAYLLPVESAGWVALALGLSLLSWLLSRHLAGRGGLL